MGNDHFHRGPDAIEAFRRERGRAPRVLHIGNTANNAYKIAKALNARGVECDVVCHDHYHIMTCPEWEEVDRQFSFKDQFHPDWHHVDLDGYERPRWFVQGELRTCLDYLLARKRNEPCAREALWRVLQHQNRTRRLGLLEWCKAFPRLLAAAATRERLRARVILFGGNLVEKAMNRARALCGGPGPLRRGATFFLAGLILAAIWPMRAAWFPLRLAARVTGIGDSRSVTRSREIVAEFKRAFPERSDTLTEAELLEFCDRSLLWDAVLREYDIVQAYAIAPLIPLLNHRRPYIAFEHGTLRDFTLADNTVARLNALAYNQADHVFITNADCLEYARKIGVSCFSGLPHPVDDASSREIAGHHDEVRRLRGVRHVFLCTLRHDWDVKGTDKYIRALPQIRDRLGDDFRLIMTNWGADIAASHRLAGELGVASLIEWIAPLPRRPLIRMMKSADVIFDQIALPHFGATAPEAMAAGVPVIMSYEAAATAWLIPEPAPILRAWTPEEIATQVEVALDPAWRLDYQNRCLDWIARWHSLDVMVDQHVQVYSRLIDNSPETVRNHTSRHHEC